jgi:hypothetical protein
MVQRRRFIGAGAAILATGALVGLPAFSSGATTTPELRSFDSANPRAISANPMTEPPLHGTNPHGQGSVAVVDISPDAQRPYVADPTGASNSEDVVVGRARGEQRGDGSYHGHITVAALFGNEILGGADTNAGQSKHESIAQDLLDGLCTSTGICLSLVRVDSDTTTTGSFNSFSLARASLGGIPGIPALSIGAAESQGSISSDGACQTTHGRSNVASINSASAVTADVATATSDAKACNNGPAPTQVNSSSVVKLGGAGLPLLAAGCGNGTADTVTGLPLLLPIVCNADDSSATGGSQASAPYGVRDALDVYVLAVMNAAAVRVSASSAESLAAAPALPTTTTPTTTTTPAATTTPAVVGTTTGAATPVPTLTIPTTGSSDDATPADEGDDETPADDGDDGGGATECSDGIDNDGDGKIDFGSDPGCASADDDSEDNSVSVAGNELPFTGTDVVVLGLAGLLLLASGLALRGPARRRREPGT